MSVIKIVFLLVSILHLSVSHPPDEITSLPGLATPVYFKQYSGYLNATEGKYLHYWFVESQRSPSTDPLLLWLNGGPGCSSVMGFLTEQGPFHVKVDGVTLYENPAAWNKIANVIFLESPVGVGYSYSDDRNYKTNDDEVAENNYQALQSFFLKFPQFKSNDFYVTGESYGGIYVPTLSVRVLTGPAQINFKGLAIGNGFLDRVMNGNSLVFFGYFHGLLGAALWKDLIKYCCAGEVGAASCNFVQPKTPDCARESNKAMSIISNSGLNEYNLYAKCVHSSSDSMLFGRRLIRHSFFMDRYVNGDIPCINTTNVETWMSRNDVREALHIPSDLPRWVPCSIDVESAYTTLYDTMKPQFLKLLNSGKLRIMVYNGDVDMACNFLGDQWFVEDLGVPALSSYKIWHNHDQVAGFVKEFRNLTLITVRGSGHMVPEDKPSAAYKMLLKFLNKTPF